MTIADKHEFEKLTAKTEWLTAVITAGKSSDKSMTESELNRAFEEYYRTEFVKKQQQILINALTEAVEKERVLTYKLEEESGTSNAGLVRYTVTLSRPCTAGAFVNALLLERGGEYNFCGSVTVMRGQMGATEPGKEIYSCDFQGYEITDESFPLCRDYPIYGCGTLLKSLSGQYDFVFYYEG